MTSIPTVRHLGKDFSIECTICCTPMDKDACIIPCGDAKNRQLHDRVHETCLLDHFSKCVILFDAENVQRPVPLKTPTYTCPIDGAIVVPSYTTDAELSSKIAAYVKDHPEVLTLPNPAELCNEATKLHEKTIKDMKNQQRLRKISPAQQPSLQRSCTPLTIAVSLFLLSAAAYAINQILFAGASLILTIVGHPAFLTTACILLLLKVIASMRA